LPPEPKLPLWKKRNKKLFVEESSGKLRFLKPLIRKIRIIYKNPLSREIRIFLIFLFIACFFWVLQSLQEVREVDIDIPLVYSEVPPRISITNELPGTLRVTLRDKGTNLYYYYRHRKDLAVHVNLMDWYRKEDIGKIPMASFDSRLRNLLLSTTQILRYRPDTISVYFAEKASKEVPVHLNSNLSLAAQHLLSDTPRVHPAMVRVFAPASVLQNLKQVETELLILEGLKDSTSVSVKLKPIKGIQYSASTIDVRLCVEAFTEKSFSVPVTGLHFPVGKNLLSFPPAVKVTFFVGLSAYSNISAEDFLLAVDYNKLLKSDKSEQKVLVLKSPKNIQNLRIQPALVECLIEENK
jgi:hypothetical protein